MNSAQKAGDQVRRRVQIELVNVLERTRLVRGQDSRQLLIDQVRDQLGPFPLREYAELRLQLVELARTCAQRADGIRFLVDVVVYLEPDTNDARDLRRLQDEWEAVDVLTEADWVELRPELETLRPENLTVLVQRATQHRLPGPPPWCDNAWQTFLHLAGYNPGPDDLPPSMAFLLLLEDHVDERVNRLIRNRNQRQAARVGIVEQLGYLQGAINNGEDEPSRDRRASLRLGTSIRIAMYPASLASRVMLPVWRMRRTAHNWHRPEATEACGCGTSARIRSAQSSPDTPDR